MSLSAPRHVAWYIMIHTPSVVFAFALVASASYALLVLTKKRPFSLFNFLQYALPAKRLLQSSTKVDLGIYILSKVTRKGATLLATLGGAATAYAASTALRPLIFGAQPPNSSFFMTLLIALSMFILVDLAAFASHSIQHKVPFLWEYHKVHHSARFLTPLTATRFHPVGDIMDALFSFVAMTAIIVVAIAFVGVDFKSLLAVYAAVDLFFTFTLLTQVQHSHFQISFGVLESIFVSPAMHQLHHSDREEHWGKNLGSRLSLWDWLAGSAVQVPKGQVLTFGLATDEHDEPWHETIVGSYIGPIKMTIIDPLRRVALNSTRLRAGRSANEADGRVLQP